MKDIEEMVQELFGRYFVLKEFNHSYITLIPKNSCPSNLSDFRLISMCNVIYKVILKILVNRLQSFMDGWMTPFQNAFISGR